MLKSNTTNNDIKNIKYIKISIVYAITYRYKIIFIIKTKNSCKLTLNATAASL